MVKGTEAARPSTGRRVPAGSLRPRGPQFWKLFFAQHLVPAALVAFVAANDGGSYDLTGYVVVLVLFIWVPLDAVVLVTYALHGLLKKEGRSQRPDGTVPKAG